MIPLRWYSGNTEIHPENTNANSCTYDGALNIPATPPEREGYNFAGWRVRPTMDFSTLPTTLNGYSASTKVGCGKCIYNNKDYCKKYDHANYSEGGPDYCLSDNNFKDLQQHEWKAFFVQGTLYGTSKCSAKEANSFAYTWPLEHKNDWQEPNTANLDNATGIKKYCWCKATGYKPANQTEIMAPSESLAWVAYSDRPDYSTCLIRCAFDCAAFTVTRVARGVAALCAPIDE